MKHSRGSSSTRRAHILVGAVVLIAVALGGLPTHVEAAENIPGTHLHHPNTFYAYVRTGEQIDAVFVKTQPPPGVGEVTMIIEGPGFAAVDCQMTAADPSGTTCDFAAVHGAPIVATQDGIWRVTFRVDSGTTAEHFGDLLSAQGRFTWDVSVSDVGGEIPGRVWSDRYYMSQLISPGPDVGYFDLSFWFQSAFGVQYRVDYTEYNGIHSIFYADPVGNRHEGTCTPAYRSIFFNDAAFSPALGECGDGAFKLFYEEPDPTLPVTATTWDGGTDWINPPVPDAPEVVNLAYAADSYEINSGLVSFDVTNFPFGVVTVEVDTDGDGTFQGAGDCSYHVTTDAGHGEQYFDGFTCDADPVPVAPSTPIRFRVVVDRIAEIHFVNFDVEARDGIEVTQLNGPGAGDKSLNWNDSYLHQYADDDPDRNFAAPPLGRTTLGGNWLTWKLLSWPGCSDLGDLYCAGATFVGADVDSTGGVHGWRWPLGGGGFNASGWGNNRHVDDWTFVEISDVTSELVVESRTSGFEVQKVSDPPSGAQVQPDQAIGYALAITNTNDPEPVAVDNAVVTDDLSDVLDDATITGGPTATSGAVAIVGNTLTWEGDVAPGATVFVTYQVTVKPADELGNRTLDNVVFTADPRAGTCRVGAMGPECVTEHTVPPESGGGVVGENEVALEVDLVGERTAAGDLAWTGSGLARVALVGMILVLAGAGVAGAALRRRRVDVEPT